MAAFAAFGQAGLRGDYFDNATISGAPKFSRIDESVDFQWSAGSPANGILPTDRFSIKWRGWVNAPTGGNVTFWVRADDGVRLWIDGRVVIDGWQQRTTIFEGSAQVSGGRHEIRLDYFDSAGNAQVDLRWRLPGQEISSIPPEALTPAAEEVVPSTPGVPTSSGPVTQAAAVRFLRQATWGPTEASIEEVKQLGLEAYLDKLFGAPSSDFPAALTENSGVEPMQEHFFRIALTGEDQLRQRVGFALSQLFVVSAVEVDTSEAIVPYVKMLNDSAFGNFGDLMTKVALNPAMGFYLDMVNNGKGNPEEGTLPNENFARELLQLFTIGLTDLNPDGTAKLDAQGRPIRSYAERDVLELARTFTGWTMAPTEDPANAQQAATEAKEFNYYGSYAKAMIPYPDQHDTGAKTVLGQRIPAGQTARQDLDTAMRIIFNHPNVGPFVARSLIQHLVTSNPSPAYVKDVAAVFANNGRGVRGDLRAVVKTILLHPEAELGTPSSGKLQEPAVFISAMLRALETKVTDHPFLTDFASEMGQKIYYAPSVFNYYSPNFRAPQTTILGPEFQIYTTALAMVRANFIASVVTEGFGEYVQVAWEKWDAAAANPDRLIEKINNLFLGGTMPREMKNELRNAINAAESPREKAQAALYLTLVSGQYQVEH